MDNLKENLIVATEQVKQLDQETQRLSQTIEVLESKVQKYKEKRKTGKREIRSLREEKLQIEIAKGNLEANIGDQQIRIDRLEKVRESQEQLIERLEAKLKEDAQTLLSNKSLIEYLNKSLNEA